MNDRKSEKAAVMTYADHEIITPPNKLRKAIKTVGANEPADDPVERAEQALSELAEEFSGWMQAEVERLDRARYGIKTHGFNKASLEALFHAAHDIKGQAATFGYPQVAPAADSLCRLIEHTPEKDRIPVTLVDQHVDAVRAILREHARANSGAVAEALSRRLREVTDEFLAFENRDHPDALEGILGPSLVPPEQPI
jgi:chemotaxis protein histidine kinase CheA